MKQSKIFGMTIVARDVAVSLVLDNGVVQTTEVADYHLNKTDQSIPFTTENFQFAGILIKGTKIERAITNFSIDGLTPNLGASMDCNATTGRIHTHALLKNLTELLKLSL